MSNRVIQGARALLKVDGQVIAIINSVSFGVNVTNEPIYTLGRFSAHEIVPTAYDPVTVNCSGFRIPDHGPHAEPKMPKLDDLIAPQYYTIEVTDRQNPSKVLAVIEKCLPVAHNITYNARAVTTINIVYIGILYRDESGPQAETPNAAVLP